MYALPTLLFGQHAVDLYTASVISELAGKLSANPARFSSKELAAYPGHHTLIARRTATGSAEIHEHEADFLILEKGEATLITGGKIINGKLQKPGEIRGTSIVGGEKHLLKVGDIVHIPAGVPHQFLVSQGEPITYFTIKVSNQ